MDMIRPTKLVVDTNAIKHNIKEIQKTVGRDVTVMPVIKSRGYGTGIGTVINLFEDLKLNIVAVAVVDEGIGLRKREFSGEIVILYQPYEDEIIKLLEYDLIPTVCSIEFIEKLNKLGKENNKIFKVHLEIDTGMNRAGINSNDIEIYIELLKKSDNIILDGIYTHFSSSDTDVDYTKEQIRKFDDTVCKAKQSFNNIKYIHACNTAGIISFSEAHYNMVRPGISLYGYLPNENLKEKIDLIPATVLKSKVIHIHEAEKGSSVGYNRTYIAKTPITIATVPVGYADGLRTSYKAGKVIINGKLANIIGKINMDSFMIDITGFKDIKVGTDVYIWDNENITLEDVAKECGTINYEILSGLAPRVVKEFI